MDRPIPRTDGSESLDCTELWMRYSVRDIGREEVRVSRTDQAMSEPGIGRGLAGPYLEWVKVGTHCNPL